MMNLAYTVLKINDKDIEQFQFPLEEYRNGHIINKQKRMGIRMGQRA